VQFLNYFLVKTTSVMTNSEDVTDSPINKTERFDKLSCHISNTTSFMTEGIKNSLEEDIMKFSSTLNREALFKKHAKISKLPYYLTVQFVRFYWRSDIKKKTKIVKPVEFPMTFDTYDLCSDELKEKLQPKRKALIEKEDERIKQLNKAKEEGKDENKSSKQEVTPMDISIDPSKMINDTGRYELFAVLTHKGYAADGGHYVAWVKEKGDQWLKFDDDKVSSANVEEIKKLSGKGGGDWHMAYLCMYRTIPFDA